MTTFDENSIDRTLEELVDQLAEGESDRGPFLTETRMRLIVEALLERIWKLEEALARETDVAR